MKLGKLKSLIGGIALSLFALCAAPAAFAQTPASDPCAGPFNGPDVNISKTGNCSITLPINVTGYVNITATGTVKTTNTVTAGGYVFMDGATGTTATMPITASGGQVDLRSDSGKVNISGAIQASSYVYMDGKTGTTAKAITSTGSYVQLVSDTGLVDITGAITASASGAQAILQGQTGVKAAAITASDHVDIRALAGDITFSKPVISTNSYVFLLGQNITSTSTLSAGSYIQATDTSIQTISIKGSVTSGTANSGQGGPILLFAQGDIATGKIVLESANAAANQAGSLDIKANLGGASSLFTLNGSAQTNGVNGTITLSTANGGGTLNNFVTGGLFITNGTSSSTGGITVNNGAISLSASASRSGIIILNAQNGTLTLPADGLKTDGAAGQGAGYIVLAANQVAATNGTSLSASQDNTSPSDHRIIISAASVTYGASGLTIHADGSGVSTSINGGVYLVPQNAIYFTDTQNPADLLWTFPFNGNPGSYAGAFSIGAGSGGPLTATSNGSNDIVEASGYPLTIGGTNVLLQSQGATSNQVYVGYFNGGVGADQLTFSNTGTTMLDASGGNTAGNNGGMVTVSAYQATINTPTAFTMNANGPSSGPGNGGSIIYSTAGSSAFGANLTGTITANASSNGTGNAVYGDPTTSAPIAIGFYPGSLTSFNLGTAAGQFSFSANGGSAGGNAGAMDIAISGTNPDVAFPPGQTTAAVSATALAGNGNGGWVYIPTLFYVDPSATVLLNGKGTGNGGEFQSNNSKAFDLYMNLKVDGGASVPSGSAFGIIKLNSISCQQWTVQSTWPKTYWDCYNPTSPDNTPWTLANSLSSALQTIYSNNTTQLFVFQNAAAFSSFYAISPAESPTLAGLTFKYAETNPMFTLYVNVAENYQRNPNGGGSVPLTTQWQEEATAHELGHAYDISESHPANKTPITTYNLVDFLNLDYFTVGTTEANSTRRNPCVGPNAPFTNAVDFTGAAVCVNGVLANASLQGHTNSWIAIDIDGGIFQSTTPTDPPLPTAYYELFAQTFAYRAYADTLSPSLFEDTIGDEVFLSNQFACSQGAANQIANGSGASGPPAYCSTTTVPSWYVVDDPTIQN